VTVDDDNRSGLEHLALDVVRWARLSVDCSGDSSPEAVVRSLRRALRDAVASADRRLLAVRIEIGGSCDAHSALSVEREKWVNQIRMEATDIGQEGAWVEKVVIASQPSADPALLETASGPIADLLAFIRRAATDSALLAELGASLDDLAAKLPAELAGEEDAFDLRDPALLADLVKSVPDVLIPRLSMGESEQ
jgi:hypothetical protein